MMHVQSHHAKLWLAGNARNWELADYQVDELKELLEDIAKRIPVYKDVPVGKMIEATTMAPIGDVEAAIKARDGKASRAPSTSSRPPAIRAMRPPTRLHVVQRPAASAFPEPVVCAEAKIGRTSEQSHSLGRAIEWHQRADISRASAVRNSGGMLMRRLLLAMAP